MRRLTSYSDMGVFYRNPGAELLSKDCPLLHELAQKILVVDKRWALILRTKANSET